MDEWMNEWMNMDKDGWIIERMIEDDGWMD